jgi:predicted kinase
MSASLGWPVVDSDRIRKAFAEIPLDERPGEAGRAALYREEMTEKTYAEILHRAMERARKKEGTIVDATFSRRAHRRRLREALQAEGVAYCLVELAAPDGHLRERLRRRDQETGVISDAREEDFERLAQGYEAPDALEEARHFQVDSAGRPPETVAASILDHLTRRFALAEPGSSSEA